MKPGWRWDSAGDRCFRLPGQVYPAALGSAVRNCVIRDDNTRSRKLKLGWNPAVKTVTLGTVFDPSDPPSVANVGTLRPALQATMNSYTWT